MTTVVTRRRLWLALALWVLAALSSLVASPRAIAAQALMPLGTPVTLAGAGSGRIAESPVDRSFEFATLQAGPVIPFQGDTTLAEVIHYGSDGQASPGVNPSNSSSVSQYFANVAALRQGGFVTAWINVAPAFPVGDGGFIAAWGGAGMFWQRFNAAGTALAPAVEAVSVDTGGPVCLAANPTGQFALGWMTNPLVQPQTSILVQIPRWHRRL